jgi:stage II sporulation protein R
MRIREGKLGLATALIVGVALLAIDIPALLRPNPGADYVRLQVVAHSNDPRDQAAKRSVVLAVREELGADVLGLRHSRDAMELARAKLGEVEACAGRILSQGGFTYGATVAVGCLDFPAKSYGGLIAPPGEYPAMRITLGEGRGDNWWCVLFPPLCFVDAPSSLARQGQRAAPPADPAELAEWVADALRDGHRPVMRSWLWEKLRTVDWRAWRSAWRDEQASRDPGAPATLPH